MFRGMMGGQVDAWIDGSMGYWFGSWHTWMDGWLDSLLSCVCQYSVSDGQKCNMDSTQVSQSVSQSVSLTEKKINLYRYFEVIS